VTVEVARLIPEQLALLDERSQRSAPEQTIVIRSSTRAKRMTLKLVPPYRIELVVPRGTRAKTVETFLSSNRAWIRRASDELQKHYPESLRQLPERIELEAIDQRWDVEIRPAAVRRLRERSGTLLLDVPDRDGPDGYELLRRWLLGQGRRHLGPWLAAEAGRLGVEPSGLQIRTQRTRWGSCSQRGGISLNAAVLLLPAELVRYLLVHELCHLRYLNHSRAYWRMVARYDPSYEAHDRALTAAWTRIPIWALPR
jgi:predicted metal-dependent hydrolase